MMDVIIYPCNDQNQSMLVMTVYDDAHNFGC